MPRVDTHAALVASASRAGVITTVQKRYSEFEKLRKLLAASYKAGVMAVAFPPKRNVGKSSERIQVRALPFWL